MKNPFLTLILLSVSMVTFGQKSFSERLSDAAIELSKHKVEYDPSYRVIDYPNGDIPENRGMDADVIVRAYRAVGIDLQKEVYEDMKMNFKKYPKQRGQKKPDANIDHRRVTNLIVFLSRRAKIGPITENARDYIPGDLVCWEIKKEVFHIGIVVDVKQPDSDRYMVVHNIGNGQVVTDCLFAFKIIGHYQYEKQK